MIAIMQPYFLPFVGYFQLIDAVDTFVLYDDAQFTKKGFMTTNRMCFAGQEVPFSLNVRDKKKIDIVRNKLVARDEFSKSCRKLKPKLQALPYFDEQLFDDLFRMETDNLFDVLFSQLKLTCDHLGIQTRLVRSSALANTQELVGKDKIIALCDAVGDSQYLNSAGGKALYDKQDMAASGVELHWLTYCPTVGDVAAPYSILQTMAEHPEDKVHGLIKHHEID
ncbi:MAG: WbqC family protein [Alphaproteobacteria bacterium]|nr:WbqC family protein [Alphaproteobacteria bacterium]